MELVQVILKNRGVQFIGAGWIGFIAENLILSENREYIIEHFGKDNYHLLYNTLSTVACGSIFYGFLRHGKVGDKFLNSPNATKNAIGFGFQSMGAVGFSQLIPKVQSPLIPNNTKENVGSTQDSMRSTSGLMVRCPMDFKPSDIPQDGIYGLERVSRHPTFWSLGLLGLGQAINTFYLPKIVFYTFPLVFACVGGWHQDSRYLRGSGGYLSQDKYEKTSNIPFVALLNGSQSWKQLDKEIKWSNASIGVALAALAALSRMRR